MKIDRSEKGIAIIADDNYGYIGALCTCNVVVCLSKSKYRNIFGAPVYNLKAGVGLVDNFYIASGNNEEILLFLKGYSHSSSRPIVYIGTPSKKVSAEIDRLKKLGAIIELVPRDHSCFEASKAYALKWHKSERRIIHFEYLGEEFEMQKKPELKAKPKPEPPKEQPEKKAE